MQQEKKEREKDEGVMVGDRERLNLRLSLDISENSRHGRFCIHRNTRPLNVSQCGQSETQLHSKERSRGHGHSCLLLI